MLCYWSGNRDEDAFVDPFSFRIDRSPNRHLAFGYGIHLCLGQMLAKMEIRALLKEIDRQGRAARIEWKARVARYQFRWRTEEPADFVPHELNGNSKQRAEAAETGSAAVYRRCGRTDQASLSSRLSTE